MPMYNLIEYGDNHSKTSRILSQFCRDVDDDDGEVTNFTDANATADFLNLKENVLIRHNYINNL